MNRMRHSKADIQRFSMTENEDDVGHFQLELTLKISTIDLNTYLKVLMDGC